MVKRHLLLSKLLKPLNLESDEKVVVGQFGAPHGVRGWIRVHSFTEPVDNLLDYQPWFIQPKGSDQWQPCPVEKVEFQAKGIVVLLKGIADRNQVALYTQCEIAVPRSLLPALPEGEYYWDDLVGLEVVTDKGVSLGKVDRLFETGSNDVLIVKDDKRERWIPYLMGSAVIAIDAEKKVITVDWDPEF